MSFNVAMLEALQAEGLDLDACIRVLKAGEKKADPTNAARQARHRENKRRNARYSNGVIPNDNTLTPEGSEAKASSQYTPPAGVSDATWADFLKSPKRKRAGMSRTAYAGICNNLNALAEHGYPPGEMVALAVERGWATVKLEWVQNDGRNNSLGRNQPADGLSPTTRAARDVFGIGPGH